MPEPGRPAPVAQILGEACQSRVDAPGRKLCDLKAVGASVFGTAFLAPTKLDCASGAETPLLGVFRKPFGGAITTLALQGEPSNPVLPPGGTTYANLVGHLHVVLSRDRVRRWLEPVTGAVLISFGFGFAFSRR